MVSIVNKTSELNLTLEQRLKLRLLTDDVMKLTLPEAQDYLIQLMTQNMVKDNLLKQWIKN